MLKAKFWLRFFSIRFYLGLQKAPHALDRPKKRLEKTGGCIPTWNNLISRQGFHRFFSVKKNLPMLQDWHELWNKLFECIAPWNHLCSIKLWWRHVLAQELPGALWCATTLCSPWRCWEAMSSRPPLWRCPSAPELCNTPSVRPPKGLIQSKPCTSPTCSVGSHCPCPLVSRRRGSPVPLQHISSLFRRALCRSHASLEQCCCRWAPIMFLRDLTLLSGSVEWKQFWEE